MENSEKINKRSSVHIADVPGRQQLLYGAGQHRYVEREIKLGTAAGVAAMIVSITVLVTAMLCNAGSIVSLDVPNLYLAGKVSPVPGGVFSIMLILGIFSACSAMMWTVCSKFRSGDDDVKKSRIFAICMVTAVFFLSLFSFSGLMSVLYPFVTDIRDLYICYVSFTKAYCSVEKRLSVQNRFRK